MPGVNAGTGDVKTPSGEETFEAMKRAYCSRLCGIRYEGQFMKDADIRDHAAIDIAMRLVERLICNARYAGPEGA